MLPLLVNLSPDPMSGAAKTPTTAVPPALVASPTDVAPSIRPQLASAITAPATLLAYAAETSQPPRPTLRQLSTQMSSQLAAQYIAQIPGANEDDLKIFTLRQRTDTQTPVDDEETADSSPDFLAQLRLARGDPAPPPKVVAPLPTPSQPSPVETALVATTANATNAIRAGREPLSGLPAVLSSQFISRLPPMLSKGAKKAGIGQARGMSAYDLATTRNANKTPTISAVL